MSIFLNLYMLWKFVSLQVSTLSLILPPYCLLLSPTRVPSILFSKVTILSPDLLSTTSHPFSSWDRLPEPCVILQILLEPRDVALYCSERKPLFCVSVCDMFLDNSSNNAICFLGGGEAKRGAARLIWWVRNYPYNLLASWDGFYTSCF